MPDTPATPSIKEAVSVLLARLPEPVRDFVTGPRRAEVAIALTKKYNLHVDQAGAFEHAFIQMLLGVVSPDEFITTLRGAGIPEEAVMGLAHDVNEEVFKPLRKAEEIVPSLPPEPVTQAPTYREPIPEPAPASTPIAPPPPPVAQAPQWTPPYPQTAPPPPQYVPMPPGTYWVPVSIAQVPPPPPPQAPAPEPAAPVAPPPQPTPEVQPEAPRPEPIPVVQPQWTAPANLPTGMPVTPSAPQIPITKEYGADPYREPV